jgi:ABC-type spermidine/putrescine transport system permease subunit II
MKNIFFFDAMLTPKIITGVYWLCLLGVLFGGIALMISGEFLRGLGSVIVGGVFIRVCFEMVIIAFKNNEYLRKIAEKP